MRRKHKLASHADRLTARGLATANQVAAALGVHPDTVKAWARDGIVESTVADDRGKLMLWPASQEHPYPKLHQHKHRKTNKHAQGGAL